MESAATPEKKQTFAKQIIAFCLAAFCMWMAFSTADPAKLWQNVQHLNLWLILLLFISGIVSHLIRAMRWLILLKPLKEQPISLFNSFTAIMIGYTVNIFLPRGGEVARLLSICKSENLPWTGVLPTMFIDRLLDIAMLALFLGATMTQLPENIKTQFPWLVMSGMGMCAAAIGGLCLMPFAGKIMHFILENKLVSEKIPQKISDLLKKITVEFDQGTRSLTNPVAYPAIAALSLAMWVFYWLNLYIVLAAFDIAERVGLVKSFVVFTIGSIGVLVPTPGSIGSYHLLVSKTLSMIAGLDNNLALAVVTVLHTISFVIVACLGAAACLALRTIMRRPSA